MASPQVDPRYAAHFANELYESNHLDAAPFGDDGAADMLYDYEQAGQVVPPDATLESLLPWNGTVADCFRQADGGDPDGLSQIYAAGFLLLRYNGEIAEPDYQILRSALVRLAEMFNLDAIRELVIPDLDSFLAAQRERSSH